MVSLDAFDRCLIDVYQRGLPVLPRPFARMASRLGMSEDEVLARLQRLQAEGVLGRVGPVFDHVRAGASLLAAVAVSDAERDRAAGIINRCPGVNHNYAREHHYNLWFVMTADSERQLDIWLRELEVELGTPVLRLPMLESFHIDLGFSIPWLELEIV